ncbi:SoxR reducing system RseC family protein [Cohnella sp. AR92]|uniref:SoxR reducing system RseC family protein n=1 Tax=Cohnella sp. AR92 TaxID=648716 RepID=UPI000F8E59B0|nr:SoxR reducing system RseC family protein [Cohnella sp. AR92]RUS43819.1 hypothetical protein ELR57_24290 [Cohnella sp. AR92]
MRKAYRCSASEWEFARYHSMIGGHKTGHKGNSLFGCLLVILIPLAMFLLYLVLAFALGTENERVAAAIGWIRELAVTAGLVVGGIVLWRSRSRTSSLTRQAQRGEEIEWMIVDEEGITLNLYHNTSPDVAPKLLWTDIRYLFVDIAKDLSRYSSAHKKLYRKQQTFDRIRARLPEFTEPAAIEYYDRFTLLINIHKREATRQGMIAQLPRSWMTNGHMADLLREIEYRSSIKAEPYDKEALYYFNEWASKQ